MIKAAGINSLPLFMDALIYSENQATDQPNSLFCKG